MRYDFNTPQFIIVSECNLYVLSAVARRLFFFFAVSYFVFNSGCVDTRRIFSTDITEGNTSWCTIDFVTVVKHLAHSNVLGKFTWRDSVSHKADTERNDNNGVCRGWTSTGLIYNWFYGVTGWCLLLRDLDSFAHFLTYNMGVCTSQAVCIIMITLEKYLICSSN